MAALQMQRDQPHRLRPTQHSYLGAFGQPSGVQINFINLLGNRPVSPCTFSPTHQSSSTISIFIVPVLFVLLTRFSYGKKKLEWLKTHHEQLMEKAKKVEEQNIDPELEYDIAQAHAENKNSS